MEAINHEYYVSLEVAKQLKEAGFDWGVYDGYIMYGDDHGFTTKFQTPYNFNGDNKDLFASYGGHKEVLSKPTLDVAQRWLREVKNLSVDISSTRFSVWEYIIRKINQLNYNDDTILSLTACRFYTYEEALEAGIKNVLEIILEKGE